MVEIDVLRCPDGTPVVFRDNRLDAGDDNPGITDGTGVVWETPRQEVLAARVLDTRETVPSLEEALAVLSPKVGGERRTQEFRPVRCASGRGVGEGAK